MQVGFVNNVTEVGDGQAVLQIGLYNRAGNQVIPLVNIRGFRGLVKKLRNKKKEIIK